MMFDRKQQREKRCGKI